MGADGVGYLGVAVVLLARGLQQGRGRLVGDAAVGPVAIKAADDGHRHRVARHSSGHRIERLCHQRGLTPVQQVTRRRAGPRRVHGLIHAVQDADRRAAVDGTDVDARGLR